MVGPLQVLKDNEQVGGARCATSVETLDAAQRAVMATELAPDEDPALLPGPDRVELHRVTGNYLPAAGPAPAKEGQR